MAQCDDQETLAVAGFFADIFEHEIESEKGKD
jgi:hypothetical protein